ncbi:MAG: AAA family ATPase, partial [Acidobacteria bacterium]|nr:AAA family ATPase [Acidobacteriota bacterium]
MRFAWVRAHPFGPFGDETLGFGAGMNVVYGPNEAGKSTWHAALYAGLCGMRRGSGPGSAEDRRLRERHRPWSAGSGWAVSTLVELEDGRRVELSRDLATRNDCRASDADRAGRDYGGEILYDGAPDGSRWLGLNRKSFLAVSSVRQAQILGLLDDAATLQEDLQRAAATGGSSATAAAARGYLTRYRRERIGSAQSRSRPLPKARGEVERARAALERARQAQADYRHVASRAERLDREANAVAERAAAVRAVLAGREAEEAERRAARAAELAARFPDGPPRDAHHDRLAEQVVAALATWRARPNPRPPSGPPVEALERELAAAAEEAGGRTRFVPRRAWAAMVGAAGTAAAVTLLLAGLPLAALAAAGLGLLGLVWSWVGPRWVGPASDGPGGRTSAGRRAWLRERLAHRREVDRRHAEDVERRARAAG